MEIFQDQSHIDRVRDALWMNYGNGASVMVGSGFSRNALKVRPGADDPPMLPNVAIELYRRLYPKTGEAGCKANVPETILADRIPSLAQEYEAAFGRADLHQLLQKLIRNDDLKPGEAHSRLLQLPWRDVFTTNWDTLLERTRPYIVARAYNVVRDMDEIPLANKPRIVKLHGSLPAQFPLIFTEEDYRTYPTKFAPFVNTVQQAMMETVFCLIGFSGNDPNFLNWSGWVRDNLGTSAPKIYLAGWLGLPPHRRRMLESRGVVPIDLARHPKADEWPEHQRHHYATEWMLHTLERGYPYDVTYWPLQSSHPYSEIPEHVQPVMEVTSKQPLEEPWGDQNEPKLDEDDLQEKVRETIDTWQHNRKVYPGWLLLPAGEARETLRSLTNKWEPRILATLPDLAAVERLNAIYELVWRREILLEPISKKLESAAEATLTSIDCQKRKINGNAETGIDWNTVREIWRTVAIALVTAVRFRFDDELFDKRVDLLKPFVNDHPDVHHRLHQEHCLRAICSMDFETLGNLLGDWTVTDCDPIWMIRKAALLWESNRKDEAEELVKSALSAIRAFPDEEGSVAGVSREGWALWSARSLDNRQEINRRWDELAAIKCDAMLEMDLISRRIEGRGRQQEAPPFDLGVRPGKSLRFSNERRDLAAYRAVRLSEVAGLPPVTNYSVTEYNLTIDSPVASGILSSAAVEMATIEPEFAIRLVLRVSKSETDNTLASVLSRSRVAVLSASSADILSNICINVFKYAFPRLIPMEQRPIFWMRRVNVAAEVLSRLALRVSSERAESFLDIALLCCQKHEVAQEFELYRSIKNLLRRTWEALPKDRRAARAVDLLNLPIIGMDNFSARIPDRFPEPGEFLKFEDLPSVLTSENDGRWHEVIRFLIRGLGGDVESRKRAASRIMLVSDRGLLTESEASEVAQTLWSEKYTSPDSLPTGTLLYDWAFLLLPEPETGMAQQGFRLKWLSGDTSRFQDRTPSDGNMTSVDWETGPFDPNRIEYVLWNVGEAISGLRHHERTLQFTDDDRNYVSELVGQWANFNVPSHPDTYIQDVAREPTHWALRGLASILEEVVIPIPVRERLYEKLGRLTDSGTPCFELIHGLVKTIPDRIDELVIWLRMGLVSDDDALAASAMSGLRSWLTASAITEISLHPPPVDLLREVGFTIASRRSVALPQALQIAEWVFKEGTSEQRLTISVLVTQGLNYLAEELRYDRNRVLEESSDLPLLRLLCVRLAQSMLQSGLREEPAVELWLKIGSEDPFPEVRYAAAPMDDNGAPEF